MNKHMQADLFNAQCPSREILKHFTSRWGVLIMVALSQKTHRFAQLRHKISGISEKMLAQTLQSLEADGFVIRVSYPVVPPHVEYSLTNLGLEASKQANALANWIQSNYSEIQQAQQNYITKT